MAIVIFASPKIGSSWIACSNEVLLTGKSEIRQWVTLDAINSRWGRGTLQPGRIAKPAEWAMRRELLSPAYTTRWTDLLKVSAR